jgi:hypothetical protein
MLPWSTAREESMLAIDEEKAWSESCVALFSIHPRG